MILFSSTTFHTHFSRLGVYNVHVCGGIESHRDMYMYPCWGLSVVVGSALERKYSVDRLIVAK